MPATDPTAIRRQAQLDALGNPANNTLPVDGPAPSPMREPSAGHRHLPAMEGWDAGNWADPNMHSVKYDAGDLLYGLTKPSDVGAKVQSQEFQQRFPGATFNGKDWIDFAGALSDGDSGEPVYGIDYLKGANPETDTSDGAWWGAPDLTQAVQPNAGMAPNGPPFDAMGVNADESLAALIAQLMGESQRGATIDALDI